MPIVYGLVACEGVVLAHYSPYTGNFLQVSAECLKKVKTNDRKFTVTCDGHAFHFIVQNGFTYLAVTDDVLGRLLPFAFLKKMADDFEGRYELANIRVDRLSLNADFRERIKQHMEFVTNNPEEASKLLELRVKVRDSAEGIQTTDQPPLSHRGLTPSSYVLLASGTAEDSTANAKAASFYQHSADLQQQLATHKLTISIMAAAMVLLIAVIIVMSLCLGGVMCEERQLQALIA